MSPMTKGILIGFVAYWALQHFTGLGNTGKAKAG
jgi:hypothetical protein